MLPRFNISIKSIKIFIDYSNVVLLKKKINALKLSTTNEKLKIIICLKFSNIFMNLKHYLNFTNYIKNHIYFYLTIFQSLQDFKITLLKILLNSDLKRKKIYVQN